VTAQVTVELHVGGALVEVSKAVAADFTTWHDQQFAAMTYADQILHFPDPRWRCAYLGKGEEKASFCVCDHQQRVFVVEAIDERTYLNGRFVTGTYFFERRVAGLAGVDFDHTALIGLRFSGLVKVREFVDGYEWARFQWRPDRRSWLDRPLTAVLQIILGARYDAYRRHYRDSPPSSPRPAPLALAGRRVTKCRPRIGRTPDQPPLSAMTR
jgi:hypothetical protein